MTFEPYIPQTSSNLSKENFFLEFCLDPAHTAKFCPGQTEHKKARESGNRVGRESKTSGPTLVYLTSH